VLDGNPNRKVIQTLKCVSGQSEDIMDRVVIEAADSRPAHTGGFGLQIQRLPDDPRFPEQVSVERLTVLVEGAVELRNHAEAEEAAGRDVLVAAGSARQRAAIARGEPDERKPFDHALDGKRAAERREESIA